MRLALVPRALVQVGQKYAGDGRYENDQWTGTVWRVVWVDHIASGPEQAGLALPNIARPDRRDVDVEIVARRLTVLDAEPACRFDGTCFRLR